MIIYKVVDSNEKDFPMHYVNRNNAIREIQRLHKLYMECSQVKPNPIMYDVDICIARFSIGSRQIYIETLEAFE